MPAADDLMDASHARLIASAAAAAAAAVVTVIVLIVVPGSPYGGEPRPIAVDRDADQIGLDGKRSTEHRNSPLPECVSLGGTRCSRAQGR